MTARTAELGIGWEQLARRAGIQYETHIGPISSWWLISTGVEFNPALRPTNA